MTLQQLQQLERIQRERGIDSLFGEHHASLDLQQNGGVNAHLLLVGVVVEGVEAREELLQVGDDQLLLCGDGHARGDVVVQGQQVRDQRRVRVDHYS